ncbi:MAG: thiamine pyrophosphate-requiring protein [Chloroflexota bacterium]
MDEISSTRTGAELLLDALQAEGVEYIFANIGTDYPAIVEAMAKYRRDGRPMPQVVLAQHEMVALSAAHGYGAATGRPQAVFVHVDVGTQNLGGSVHNACRARIPVFILAGLSPITTKGELPGSRSSNIHYLQDVADQPGIVRQYAKWTSELRTALNAGQIVSRAFQVARSEPAGLVYLTAPREALEQVVETCPAAHPIASVAPSLPADEGLRTLAAWLAEADMPLLITSYAGRHPGGLEALVELAEAAGMGVVESEPYFTNFPTAHPHHLGSTPSPFIGQADLLLLVDVDVPWLPGLAKPRDGARVAQIDIDAVKASIPLWDFAPDLSMQGHAPASLRRLAQILREQPLPSELLERRRRRIEELHRQHYEDLARNERAQRDRLTPATVAGALDRALGDSGIVLNEAVSNGRDTLRRLRRGGGRLIFQSGGSALGWSGGAALGTKLARPDTDVATLVGDGAFVFSVPTAVFWAARRYQAPFLSVILNNSGWNAVKSATLQQHPEGIASQTNDFSASFQPISELTLVAQSSGAHTAVVDRYDDLEDAISGALEATRRGQAAVLDVRLDQCV